MGFGILKFPSNDSGKLIVAACNCSRIFEEDTHGQVPIDYLSWNLGRGKKAAILSSTKGGKQVQFQVEPLWFCGKWIQLKYTPYHDFLA